MKKAILIIFLFFIYSCGYTSIYNNLEKQDFKIIIVDKKGDRVMNNLIKNELRLYSNTDSVNIYNIKIDTDYKKDIIAKNSSGVITDYSLTVSSTFIINFKDQTKVLNFEEKINIKNQTNSFEQNIYEKNIQRNFASSIRTKLLTEILNINDN